jgi:hypothetical protein
VGRALGMATAVFLEVWVGSVYRNRVTPACGQMSADMWGLAVPDREVIRPGTCLLFLKAVCTCVCGMSFPIVPTGALSLLPKDAYDENQTQPLTPVSHLLRWSVGQPV